MNQQSSANVRAQVQEFGGSHRTGWVTLLFTDIVGSTERKHRLGDRTGATVLQRHRRFVRELLSHFPGGQEIETAGDSFLMVFAKPSGEVVIGRDNQMGESARKRFDFNRGNIHRITLKTYDMMIAEGRGYAAALRRMREAAPG